MAEPKTFDTAPAMAALKARLDLRGLGHITSGPADPASDDQPGHPEFHRRARAEFALGRWRTATPRRYQNATATHPRVIAWANHAAANPDTAPGLLLTGTTGTGKTHEAYGALRHIAEAGPRQYELVATTAADMYGALRPGGSTAGTEHELRRLARVPLLLLDDLGSAKPSEWVEEITYRLINERYNQCRVTIFTSNLPAGAPTGTPDLTRVLGDRIVSRLAEMTTIVAMAGADRRRAA